MTIEKISRSTIKIALSGNELNSYNMNFAMLDSDSIETRNMLISLLETIQNRVDIDLSSDSLFIEAFASSDGGCLLYISVIDDIEKYCKRPKIKTSPFITITAEFESMEDMIIFCKLLTKTSSNLILNSQLYYNENIFRLILEINSKFEKKLSKMLLEFGKIAGTGELTNSYTKEYFYCIEKYNAIKKLATLKTV